MHHMKHFLGTDCMASQGHGTRGGLCQWPASDFGSAACICALYAAARASVPTVSWLCPWLTEGVMWSHPNETHAEEKEPNQNTGKSCVPQAAPAGGHCTDEHIHAWPTESHPPSEEGKRAATAAQGMVGKPRALEQSRAKSSTACPRPRSWLMRYLEVVPCPWASRVWNASVCRPVGTLGMKGIVPGAGNAAV